MSWLRQGVWVHPVMFLSLFVMPPGELLTVMFTENKIKCLSNFREFLLKMTSCINSHPWSSTLTNEWWQHTNMIRY